MAVPARLALALAADNVLGNNEQAQDVYQQFKWKVIGRLEQEKPWTLTEPAARAVLEELLRDRGTDQPQQGHGPGC